LINQSINQSIKHRSTHSINHLCVHLKCYQIDKHVFCHSSVTFSHTLSAKENNSIAL